MVYGVMAWSVAGVNEQTVEDWADQVGATFPIFFEGNGGTYSQYDAVGRTAPFPLDVVIDKQGIVRYVDTRYDPDAIEALVVELLEE